MYIGVDIGGTNTRIASSNSLKKVVIQQKISFKNTRDFDRGFLHMCEEIQTFRGDLAGIGIGIAGTMSEDKQSVAKSTNCPELVGKPIVEALSEKFSCPVVMDNDGVTAAFGEALYGSGAPHNFTFIIWGTGIGGATVQEKQGAISAEKIQKKYLEHWERACGGRNLEQKFGLPENLSVFTWNVIMTIFAVELQRFIAIAKPKCIIFGGGIAIKKAELLEKIFLDMKKQNGDFSGIDFRISNLGEDAGLYGAFGLLSQF